MLIYIPDEQATLLLSLLVFSIASSYQVFLDRVPGDAIALSLSLSFIDEALLDAIW